MRVTVHVDGSVYRADWSAAMVELYRDDAWCCACLWDGSLGGAAIDDLVAPGGDGGAVRTALEAAIRAAREASDAHEPDTSEPT